MPGQLRRGSGTVVLVGTWHLSRPSRNSMSQPETSSGAERYASHLGVRRREISFSSPQTGWSLRLVRVPLSNFLRIHLQSNRAPRVHPCPWQETGEVFPQPNFRDLACVCLLPIESTSAHETANLVSLDRNLKWHGTNLGRDGEAQCPFGSINRVRKAPCTSSDRPHRYSPKVWLCERTPSHTPEKSVQKRVHPLSWCLHGVWSNAPILADGNVRGHRTWSLLPKSSEQGASPSGDTNCNKFFSSI